MCAVKQGVGNLTILSYNTNLRTGRGEEREGGAGTLAREGLKEVRELQRDVSESVPGQWGRAQSVQRPWGWNGPEHRC